jgi:hypothetical protein
MILFMSALMQVRAQEKFEKVSSVKNLNVTVKVLSEKMTVLVPGTNANQRYLAAELPDELKKDGLHLTVDGDIGKIPPNVRMAGTPFRITCIKVSKEEEKKYKLPKRKYCFK